MSSRPPSRIFTTPHDFTSPDSHTHLINVYLSAINPRALATSSPNDSNIDMIKYLYHSIQILNLMKSCVNTTDSRMLILCQTQMKVIVYLYNHIAFLLSNKWIPN